MPTLRKTVSGEYIFSTQGRRRMTHLCVMEYFDGSYLQAKNASNSDIRLLAEYMATIHSHKKRIHHYYDTMGIVNFLSQYKKLLRYLSTELRTLVLPVVRDFSKLNLSTFRHSIIHGTFEPENILKNAGGDLCLLDLGCMDYHASVVDIATFLANYTIDLTPDKKRDVANIFLHAYQTARPLTAKELAVLPTLVRSQYAVYSIRTNYYRVRHKDTSQQTSRLFSMGKRGLKQWIHIHAL